MKRTANVPEKKKMQAAADNKMVEEMRQHNTVLEKAQTYLFPVLLFFVMTVQTPKMAVFMTALALVCSFGKLPLRHLRESLSLPVAGLLAFAFMNAFAAIYSPFGTYAVTEFYKVLSSVSLALIVLLRFRREHVRALLWGFAAVCAVIALICVDSGGPGALFDGFVSFMSRLGADYASATTGNTFGTRINGIYNDANLTGSLLALSALVGLYLVRTEEKRWKRLVACILLGISAIGFFLAMSRGAILCFAVALVVYMVAAGKGNRLPLFILMVESAVVTVALSVPAMASLYSGAWLADLLTLVCGVLIFGLDTLSGVRLAAKLAGHGKAIAVAATGLAVVCVGYGVAAVNITEAYTIREGEVLARSTVLPAGEYTLSGDWDEGVQVAIYTQTKLDAVKETYTSLYSGDLKLSTFTMPEDVRRAFFRFYGAGGETMRAVKLSNGTTIKLGYKLIPQFVANRLQEGLFGGTSYLLRVQYDKDGLRLFAKSPLIGHGLGSTEGLLPSVQPFFYESLYIHNHLIQVMDEMGLVGLAAFLMLLGGVLWLLCRRLRAQSDALAAMLLACFAMMNLHGLMEISFSIQMFQCAAYFLLMLAVIQYAEPVSEKNAKKLTWASMACIWAWLLIFGGLYVRHMVTQKQMSDFSTSDVNEMLDAAEKFTRGDVFDHEQLQLTYVGNAVYLDAPLRNATMLKYVKELRDSGTYSACSGLAGYYYLPKGELAEVFAVSREGIAQQASRQEAWNQQFAFYRDEVLPAVAAENMPEFIAGVLATESYLTTFSEGRMEEITIDEANKAFLTMVDSIKEQGLDNEAAYALLSAMVGTGESAESGT